ncbi:hypothetical protein Tco_1152573 [Tanacetum coccineum]
MDDPNLTMEEYIRLEEEKAHKRGKVFNWQTATYGKIRVDDDLHNLSSVEAEFPAIVINDAVVTQDELQCKSQIWLFHQGRLAKIHRREVHRVPVFNFGGLSDLMAEGLSGRMLMEHRDEASVSIFITRDWRRMFDIRGPLVYELILEFFSEARRCMSWRQFFLALGLHTKEEMQTAGFGVYWAKSTRQIPDKGDLRDYWMRISSARDFLGTAPS